MTTRETLRVGTAYQCQEWNGSKNISAIIECNRSQRMYRLCEYALRDYEIEWVEVDHSFGYLNCKQPRSLCALISKGQIDTVNGLFHTTYQRQKIYQFTKAIYHDIIKAHVSMHPQRGVSTMFSFLLHPYSQSAWIAVFLILFSACLVVVAQQLCQVSLRKTSKSNVSSAISIVTKAFALAYLCTAYGAKLKSVVLAPDTHRLPSTVVELAGQIASGRLTLVTSNLQSSVYETINQSENLDMKTLRAALQLNPVYSAATTADACRLVLKGDGMGRRFVFIAGFMMVDTDPFCAAERGMLKAIQLHEFITYPLSIIVAKTERAFRLRKQLNVLSTSGIPIAEHQKQLLLATNLSRIVSNTWVDVLSTHSQRIGMHEFKGVLIVDAACTSISIVALLAEILWATYRRRILYMNN